MSHVLGRVVGAVVLAVGLAVGVAGCSSGPQFGTVSGTVRVNGQPGAKLRVEFHPDATKGTAGPSSSAETDDQGRYVLKYATSDRTGDGAAVGWHKVVLSDLILAGSETGRDKSGKSLVRFGPEYSGVLTTPLDYEVKPGDQTIDIEVPKP